MNYVSDVILYLTKLKQGQAALTLPLLDYPNAFPPLAQLFQSLTMLSVVSTFISKTHQLAELTFCWSEVICYFKEDNLDYISSCLQAVSILMWLPPLLGFPESHYTGERSQSRSDKLDSNLNFASFSLL